MSDPVRRDDTDVEEVPRNRLGNAAATMLNPPSPEEAKKEPQLELKRRPPRRPSAPVSSAPSARPVEVSPVRAVPDLPSSDETAAVSVAADAPQAPSDHAVLDTLAADKAEELSDVSTAAAASTDAAVAFVHPQTDPERGRGRPRRAELDSSGSVVPRTGRVETSVTMPSELRDRWFGYASAQSFSKSEVLMDAFDLVADDLPTLAASTRSQTELSNRRGSMFYRPPAPGEKGAHALVSAPLRLHATNLEVIDRLAAEHRLNRSQLVALVLREFFVRNPD